MWVNQCHFCLETEMATVLKSSLVRAGDDEGMVGNEG